MNRYQKTVLIGLATCAVVACLSYAQDKKTVSVTPAGYAESKEWPTYGHDSGGMRYSPLTQITPANVSNWVSPRLTRLQPVVRSALRVWSGRLRYRRSSVRCWPPVA